MEATKAIIRIQERNVEITEAILNALNQALASCPCSEGSYGDSKPKAELQFRLVPKLEIVAQAIKRES